MSSVVSNTQFSLEYAVSIIVIIIVCSILYKSSPQMNTLIIVITGLLVGYITLFLINKLFPFLNLTAFNLYQYFSLEVMNNFNSMGYIHVWPPLLAVLILFVILLYNRQLG